MIGGTGVFVAGAIMLGQVDCVISVTMMVVGGVAMVTGMILMVLSLIETDTYGCYAVFCSCTKRGRQALEDQQKQKIISSKECVSEQ